MLEFLKTKINKSVDTLKAGIKGEVILTEENLGDFADSFRIALLESDVAFDVAEEIIAKLKEKLKGRKVKKDSVKEEIKKALREIIEGAFFEENLIENIKSGERPYVILFVGINGSGKTTTIAKLANYLRKHNLSCIIAASDTFRAGAIEQIEKHAGMLGIKLIKHGYGSDPAAVAYDAINSAKAKSIDVVLIDTAGRAETNKNLMQEMKKIARVTKPSCIIFVGDALTGNAIIDQIKNFEEACSIDGVILTKADADAKGGAAISIAFAFRKPIYFLGVGQGYDDLIPFRSLIIIDNLLS